MRYYWLKLKRDFFSRGRIKKMLSELGAKSVIIYLKMLLFSLSENGEIITDGTAIDEWLSWEIDENQEDINRVIHFLNDNKMLETTSAGIMLLEALKNIGSESESAERVRNFRERQRQAVLHSNGAVTDCNTDKRRKEKEKKREEGECRPARACESESASADYDEIKKTLDFLGLTEEQYVKLNSYVDNILALDFLRQAVEEKQRNPDCSVTSFISDLIRQALGE